MNIETQIPRCLERFRYTRKMQRTLLLLSSLALVPLPALAGDAPAPIVKAPGDVDFHASGSLPPGAE